MEIDKRLIQVIYSAIRYEQNQFPGGIVSGCRGLVDFKIKNAKGNLNNLKLQRRRLKSVILG
jgi:hypothetical protein